MNAEELVKQRMIESIGKTFPKPTPLIGDRWFKFSGDGRGYCQFIGVTRLAKATGIPAKKIGMFLLKNLDLRPLLATAVMNNKCNIVIDVAKASAKKLSRSTEAPGISEAVKAAQIDSESIEAGQVDSKAVEAVQSDSDSVEAAAAGLLVNPVKKTRAAKSAAPRKASGANAKKKVAKKAAKESAPAADAGLTDSLDSAGC